MKLTDWELDTLHRHQLSILEEIQRICKANDVTYFAIAGTLLGAVRHKSFIPWDDDIDLGMLRHEYRKFLACAAHQLSSEFFLQTWDTDPGFGLPMAKVRLNNTKIIESASADVECHRGIFVDIFPFDEKPDSAIRRCFHAVSAFILKRALLARSGYTVGSHRRLPIRVAFKALLSALRIIPTRGMIRLFEAQMMQFNDSDSKEFVTVAGSYGYRRESLRKTWTEDLVEYDFDRLKVCGFRDASLYLSHMYGDFLKLPPISQRGNRHGIESIDFGV